MTKQEVRSLELFDLSKTIARELFEKHSYPWEVLAELESFILELGKKLDPNEYDKKGDDIWIHKTAKIAPTVSLKGPAIICEGAELRQSAFIRGSVIIGRRSIAGNSCEFKNSVLFDDVQTPHYNYVGDSVLGHRSHMGASSLTSNVKSDKSLVKIHLGNEDLETGRKKVGAILGDYVEVGCGSVLNPGTVVGKNSIIYPLSSVRGTVPADSIYKSKDDIVKRR